MAKASQTFPHCQAARSVIPSSSGGFCHFLKGRMINSITSTWILNKTGSEVIWKEESPFGSQL